VHKVLTVIVLAWAVGESFMHGIHQRESPGAHSALEAIVDWKRHWMPFGMQEAIGAGIKRASLVSRGGAVCYMQCAIFCTTALLCEVPAGNDGGWNCDGTVMEATLAFRLSLAQDM
jgi:hypothetical protein